MRLIQKVCFICFVSLFVGVGGVFMTDSIAESSIYAFKLNDITGQELKLEQYEGKVLLLVNVASQCGFTPQYKGLQEIFDRYKDNGLVVIGVPANNFGGQEPGSNEEIKTFCESKFGVSFPMMSKISVKGDDIHPLYAFLTQKESNPQFSGSIKWNFTKFLINRQGKVIARYGSMKSPTSRSVKKAIEMALEIPI